MKKIILIFCFIASFPTYAQLLDSLALDTIKAYTSLSEALKNPEQVIKLELKRQHYKTFPKDIFKFKNLQYLDLSKNSIKEIPDSIEVLSQLQYLNMSKNMLQMLNGKIGKLTNLVYLNLNNNEFSALPTTMGNLVNLRTLDLWSNNLDEFPENIKNMKSLQVLDLRAILITDEVQNYIKSLFPNTTIYLSPSCNCKW